MVNIKDCILYRNFEHGEILDQMVSILQAFQTHALEDADCLEEKRDAFYNCMNGLAEMAGSYGFSGNLWHDYLTFLLVNHENAFSTACEITGPVEGSINELAKNDFRIFKSLYDFDITQLDSVFSSTCAALLSDYINVNENSKLFNKRIRDRICSLSDRLSTAATTEEFMMDMVDFYKDFGVGKLGLHKAFRLEHKTTDDQVQIVPITRIAHVQLDDLVGYEIPKKKLIDNTEAFIKAS